MQDEQQEAGWEFRPGDTIQPGDSSPQPASSPSPAPAQVETTVQPVASATATLQLSSDARPQSDEASRLPVSADGTASVSWTASEFVHHAKSIDWYLALGIIAIIVSAAVYWFSRDEITTGAILVVAAAFGFYGHHQPRQLQYLVNHKGLTIESKFYPYQQFRSFSIYDEGPFSSIGLMPMKRFGLPLTIYYDPADEDAIIDIISAQLPLEPREHDPLDRLMRRIGF